MQFGSKIDGDGDTQRLELFSVKEVISPELIKLNNDLIVRLIGVRQNPALNGEAKDYLQKKLHNKRVFFKFDETKYDAQNHLMVYLYLENKTFINAHLLKDKMALVDDSIDFKYKTKFKTVLS